MRDRPSGAEDETTKARGQNSDSGYMNFRLQKRSGRPSRSTLKNDLNFFLSGLCQVDEELCVRHGCHYLRVCSLRMGR